MTTNDTEDNERSGDYIEQHYVLDSLRLEDALYDQSLQISVDDGVDVLTLDLTDDALEVLKTGSPQSGETPEDRD